MATPAARRAERHLVDRLRRARAVDPASAAALPDLHWMHRRRLTRLVGRGVIRPAVRPAGGDPDRYYLDEARYVADRDLRRRRVAAVLVLVVLLAGVLLYWTPRTAAP